MTKNETNIIITAGFYLALNYFLIWQDIIGLEIKKNDSSKKYGAGLVQGFSVYTFERKDANRFVFAT